MTIQVISNSDPVAAPAAVRDAAETKSEPVATTAAEQSASTEADAEETGEGKEAAAAENAEQDEAEASEGDADAEAEGEKDKARKKSGAQRRKERAERAEAEVERLRRLVEDMARNRAGDPAKSAEPTKPTTEAKASDGKPTPESFETHAEYVEALTDWKLEQKLSAKEAEQNQAKLKSEQDLKLKSHFDRVEAFKKTRPDFDDVVSEAATGASYNPTVEALIIDSENGPALMYELAQNADEFIRICALPPLAAAREVGRIESRLSKPATDEPKEEPKKTTKAPKPIEPVGSGKAAVAKSIHDPDISFKEYEAIRRKQLAARNTW